MAACCLGCVPVLVMVGPNFWLQATIAHILSEYVPNAAARADEEMLAHTYFTLVAANFTPCLIIRLGQQFRQTRS
jgi:hypothetical protein